MVPFYDLLIGIVSPRYIVAPLYKFSVGLFYLGARRRVFRTSQRRWSHLDTIYKIFVSFQIAESHLHTGRC